MIADEIRHEYRWDIIPPEHAHLFQIQVIAEVAAQLAEANGIKRMEMGVEFKPEPVDTPNDYVHLSRAAWDEILEIINTARKLNQDSALVSTSTGEARANFSKLDKLLDSYDSPPF